MPTSAAGNYDAYKTVNVETASQGKLIIMLFNGAIQRCEEAKRQIQKNSVQGVHSNLIRAQDIIAELRSALNMNAGEIASNLDRIYEYIQHLLIDANVRKDVGPIEEAVAHMTGMRDTWEEVFEKVASEETAIPTPPQSNQHGAALFNLQG